MLFNVTQPGTKVKMFLLPKTQNKKEYPVEEYLLHLKE